MTVEEMDRLVAALPEWERMPAPAARVSEEVIQFARFHAEEARRHREKFERKMAAIRRTERVLFILVASLSLGIAVAGIVTAYLNEARQATFLPERP